MAAGSGSSGKGGAIRAGRAVVEAGLNDAGLRAGLERARKMVIGFGAKLSIGGGLLAGFGGSIVATIVGSFKSVVNQFDAIKKASDRLGTSAEIISSLGYAASQSGSDLEGMETSLKFLQKNLEQNGDSFKEFGLDAEKLKGMKLEDQFMAVADAISQMEDGSQRTNAALTLLGKSGTQMLPLMKGGAAGIKQLMDEAARVGKIVSSEDAANAERAGDAIDRAWISVKMTFLSVGAALLPSIDRIEQLSDLVVDSVKVVRDFINENRQLVLIVLAGAAALTGIGIALVGLGGGIVIAGILAGPLSAIGTALAAIVPFIVPVIAIGAAFVAVGAIVASIVADFADLATLSQSFGEIWGWLGRTFQSTWSGISDALAAGDLKLAFEIAVAGLNVVWTGVVLALTVTWNMFKGMLVDTFHDASTQIKLIWSNLSGTIQDVMLAALQSIAEQFSKTFSSLLKSAAAVAGAVGLDSLSNDLKTIDEVGAGAAIKQARADLLKEEMAKEKAIKAAAALAQSERNLARKNDALAAARDHLEALNEEEAKKMQAKWALLEKGMDAVGDLAPMGFNDRAAGARNAINSISAFGNATSGTLGIGGGKTVEDKQLDVLKDINKGVQKIQGAKAGI